MYNKQIEIFFNELNNFIESKELIKLVLSNKKDKSSDLKNIIVTIVKLKSGFRLNFVYRHHTKDITKNHNFEEGQILIKELFNTKFYNAEISGNSENLSIVTNLKGKTRLKRSEPTLQPLALFKHDRVKERPIKTDGNIYLRELGIVNANWEVRHEMRDKFKQINKYIELLSPYFKEVEIKKNFHIADMGAGKGYLTFALYDYLTNSQSKNIRITGVEFRDDLVKACNAIAEKANFNKLTFIKGTIEKAEIEEVDVLIALHACDTATDEAIYRGIKENASLIVCAPCCHKQIRKEFNVTNELSNIVSHGILKERQAEIITDGLRALIMELHGYKTKVFEFISTEHTPKNIMIVGRKVEKGISNKKIILNNIEAIKNFYGIKKHYLERLSSNYDSK
ncbi:MAG: SAM-dependent methyltransferase [Melioribacteraceae bacterium]|nr:SAM-dependent methyltransferase [Melioribacteraceae bacterium]